MPTSAQGQVPGPWAEAKAAQSSPTHPRRMPASRAAARRPPPPSSRPPASPRASASSAPARLRSRRPAACRSSPRALRRRRRYPGRAPRRCGPTRASRPRCPRRRPPPRPARRPPPQAPRSPRCLPACSPHGSMSSGGATLPTTGVSTATPPTRSGRACPLASSCASSAAATTGRWARTSRGSEAARWTPGRSGSCRSSTTAATGIAGSSSPPTV
mmetsp:Transcript_71896/g.222257  ORF Transcript_71896/g.222257 Transcript_71896/m.222257 type:complete len:215 (-) Transcript_71896:326-970(-)